MRYIPLILVAVFVIIALVVSRRAKLRSAATDARMRRDTTVGSQVMTTSGLYGTVVVVNSDDTVILAIAPGVEVRWAFAALRHADSLPPRYRRAAIENPSNAVGNPAANPASSPRTNSLTNHVVNHGTNNLSKQAPGEAVRTDANDDLA